MIKDEYSVSGGASGAIFGVVGALLVIVIRNRGQLEDLNSRQLMLFAGFSIYHGVTSAGIDNMAHISGFVIGALLGGTSLQEKAVSEAEYKMSCRNWYGFYRQMTVMGRNNGLNDCKSKPGAACLIGHKRLKNTGQLFWSHAVAGVTDRKHKMIAVIGGSR